MTESDDYIRKLAEEAAAKRRPAPQGVWRPEDDDAPAEAEPAAAVIAPRDLEDAEDGTEFRLGAFPSPPVEDCPIVFLGFYGGRVVFAMPEGEIRDIGTADVGRLIQVDLFNSPAGQAFLGYWRDREDKFQRNAAAIWFIRQCREAGLWDAGRPQRGLGVWPAAGGAILHRGNELWLYRPGERVEVVSVAAAIREAGSGPIYRLRPKAPTPAAAPAGVEAGQWARKALDLWRFEPIGEAGLTGADLVAGWLAAALLGAVAPFRPHLLTYAQAGSGKTTLIRFVHGLAGALAGDVLDSFTRAGLANDLAGNARPVIIDEAEATPAGLGLGPIEQALELIRRMATGDGALRKMGDIGGGTVTQTAVGAVMLAAVNPVRLAPADASRIAEARLRALAAPAFADEAVPWRLASEAEVTAAIARARELAPAMLARALVNADRFVADAAELKAAFGRLGHSPRAGDLVAALAAGRRMLLSDEPLTRASADEEAALWADLLAARELAEVVGNTGQDALAHLLTWPSGKHVHDRVISLGEVIKDAASRENKTEPNELLKEFGLKVQAITGEDGKRREWLFVANKHPSLERIFERTVWRDHRRSLAYLDELGEAYRTQATNKAVRFGLIVQRAIGVPLDPWLVTPGYTPLQERYSQDDE